MKIGVTGATGQLGRMVVDKLKEKVSADSVVALVRNPEKAAGILVISKFIQIFINDIQPFFNPFCSVADDFKQSLCYKLWSDHRIEKCITVYRYCKKYVGIFRKKRTWFVRNDYNRGTGVMCHLCSYFILRRITRKTEQYQTICM